MYGRAHAHRNRAWNPNRGLKDQNPKIWAKVVAGRIHVPWPQGHTSQFFNF